MKPPPPFIAITLLSAASIGYELLLLRLFSIIQWHHFAYMIISLALLGIGASGTFLALTRHRANFTPLFAINAVLFGLSAFLCFHLVQYIPFNPLELLWDWQQLFYLFVMYLLLAIPFFFAANGIGLSFYHFQENVGHIYSADLLGAGLGALGVVLLLFIVSPLDALIILAILGMVSAAISIRQCEIMWLVIAMTLIIFPIMRPWATLQISSYKGLSQTLHIFGTKILQEQSSPLGLLSVVESPKIPFHYAPGLSINSTAIPPQQLGVFTDSDAFTVINHYTGEELNYLDFLTSALPYHLLERPFVLLLGAGGGTGVLQALYHNASHADAVELNPQIVDLVRQDYADFAGRIYDHDKVQIHLAEARGFVAGSKDHYDLIQVSQLDSFGASSAGLYALSENYLYTVEALEQFLARLNPGGLLAITRWLKLPPRDSLKLFATAVIALENLGVETPGERLALIRGWKTSTLLIKNGAFTASDIAKLHHFCEERTFDVAYYSGISPTTPNQYNLLNRPYFYEGATALLGTARDDFMTRYKYNLTPATDDRPYFFNFFKWQLLPELFSKRGSGILEWGYPLLIATLLQAAFASILFILLPLFFLRTSRVDKKGRRQKKWAFVYFLSLGLAFLFVEMAFIQKFILFLNQPLYAVAVVLGAFLIFAGLGSRYSSRLSVSYAVTGIAVFALLYLVLLPPLLEWLTPLPEIAKVLISLLLIAPLAFWMGMPFPLGLTHISRDLIPWAWAVNGCASVLSAVMATVLAIHFGFTVVILLAVSLYGVAALAFPGNNLHQSQ